MLEYSHLSLHSVASGDRHTAYTSKKMHITDEWLVATKTECDVGREIVVGLAGTLTKRVAIRKCNVDVRIPFATHE